MLQENLITQGLFWQQLGRSLSSFLGDKYMYQKYHRNVKGVVKIQKCTSNQVDLYTSSFIFCLRIGVCKSFCYTRTNSVSSEN